ncbi:MAG: hypothetical protein J6Y02_09065 [Pseudobutyrivibrio sp.]|nr:hypothetical protein [Pseudobutyrivibrio sp.]
MKILLHRSHIGEFATSGTLSIAGEYITDTAEHSLHKVPAGTYHIGLIYSKLFHRKMPFLMEAPDVCLAFGNGIYTCTDGRILLGTTIIPGIVKNSREPFLRLYDRINQSLRRGHEVLLEIKEKEK